MTLDWIVRDAESIDHISREDALSAQGALTYPPGQLGVMQYVTADFAGWQGQTVPLFGDVVLHAFRNKQDISLGFTPNQEIRSVSEVSNIAGHLQSDYAVSQLGVDQLECNEQHSAAPDGMQSINSALAEGHRIGMHKQRHLLVGIALAHSNTQSARSIYDSLLRDNASAQPLKILQSIGCLEIAALVGAYIGAAHAGVPVLVNGFVATAAALLTVRLNPSVRQWMLFTHVGSTQYQRQAMQRLSANPILDAKLQVSEQTALTSTIEVIRSALGLHQRLNQRMAYGVSAAASFH